METGTCWSCGAHLPERAIFCAACATQARCKECRDMLEPKARACVACGALVGEGNAAPPRDGAAMPVRIVNTLEFVETEERRSLHANLTDEAVRSLSDTIGLLIAGRIGSRTL